MNKQNGPLKVRFFCLLSYPMEVKSVKEVLRHGITVLNTPGTIDADYRGEIGVVLVNLSDTDFEVNPGERIAQMVIAKHEQVDFEVVSELDETERGAGGYGHTGTK